MKLNFRENDYWVTLTYKLENRPQDMKEAAKDIRKWIQKVRAQYKRQEVELKWMLHTEIGSRGGVHHHLVINRIPDADLILRKAWEKGGVHIDLLYDEGGLRKLAEYLSKTPDEENKLKEPVLLQQEFKDSSGRSEDLQKENMERRTEATKRILSG